MLQWGASGEPDFSAYRLYRGTSADFVPGPGNLLATQGVTGYVDAAGAPYFYKLTAVDVHGNESPASLAQPSGTADVPGGGAALEPSLAGAVPSPARGEAVIRFVLPRPGSASLTILDAGGRQVRELPAGQLPAGAQALRWDGRDAFGSPAAPGLYWVVLRAGERILSRRFVMLR
jgi:hypothetical protein